MPAFICGLDLGQAADPSALVIVERRQDLGYDPSTVRTVTTRPLRTNWAEPGEVTTRREVLLADGSRRDLADLPAPTLLSYDVRHAMRFPLGTSYPAIVSEVAQLLGHPPLRGNVTLVIDATGVGRPVCDLFTLRADRHYAAVKVIISGGSAAHYDEATGYWSVPKRDLVSCVQVPLQNKQLRFPEVAKLPTIDVLMHELSNFRVTISAAGNDSYAAWRERDHDDLVLALALALWQAARPGILAGWL